MQYNCKIDKIYPSFFQMQKKKKVNEVRYILDFFSMRYNCKIDKISIMNPIISEPLFTVRTLSFSALCPSLVNLLPTETTLP